MASYARGSHVSPGVYTQEIQILPAVKSLGISSLGLCGETVKGPAFQPMGIANWREFTDMFGGTDPSLFKGSKYPKYELPYVAKSYLEQSQRLTVCRVLGLSGYNAGPAWCVTGEIESGEKMVIAVIRSRGHYEEYYKFNNETGTCACQYQSFDQLLYDVGEMMTAECNKPKQYNMNALKIGPYIPLDSTGNECVDYTINGEAFSFLANASDYGKFKLYGWTGVHSSEEEPDKDDPTYFEYPVSLNPLDNDYILKVLGTSAEDGDAPIFVESLYDVAWIQQIQSAPNDLEITNELTPYQVYYASDLCGFEPVYDFMYKQEEQLTRNDLGRRFLATEENVAQEFHCHLFSYKTGKPVFKGVTMNYSYNDDGSATSGSTWNKGIDYTEDTGNCKGCVEKTEIPQIVEVGQIYTVAQYTDESGKRHYYYRYYSEEELYLTYLSTVRGVHLTPILDKLAEHTEAEVEGQDISTVDDSIVKNNADDLYYRLSGNSVQPVKIDLNNYKTQYRFASTPWVVSNLKGDFEHLELNKLFRFHTISDGNASNQQIKVSIANIDPDAGVFDVQVRDINDTDSAPLFLERYQRCSLVPGTSNYLGLKIGTYDGAYETVSKYITVEIIENDNTRNSIPCGFLGYPIHDYSGLPMVGQKKTNVIAPILKYNLNYDVDIKNRKQYFGLSDITGVDVDAFTFKGCMSYYDSPSYLSQGFHLDSRLDFSAYNGNEPTVSVDNETGYTFDAISVNNRTTVLTELPVISKEIEMAGSIYEYKDLRKFTMYFYGGFDGWDVYRDERSNTDNFKKTQYRGNYNDVSGEGYSFNKVYDPESIGLNQAAITSDFYAYLAAIRQFANKESTDINIFATPGIDYVNQKLLVQEVIEMVEEERGDSIYVVTTPDKPSGANDYLNEMYTPDDAVLNLEDTEIDSNYTCTYYPWVKYFDSDNNQYIMLPPTKDVVRNMAYTDNTAYPWYAPAGITRGDVDCVRAHFVTKLADEDVLYEGRINPIKTFANDGVKLWGQKTLQVSEGQLNRINVRRLMLRIKALVTMACNKLIFEPNDATTKNKFISLVSPILDNVKNSRGISDYRIEVDDSVEARERLELPARIFIKPINALEYIDITFVITPESVNFDDIA